MKNIKDKKNIIIIGLVILVIIIILFFIVKKNRVTFYINGENTVYIDYGMDYNDLGFVAKDGLGNDLSNKVTVVNNVNVNQPGAYKVIYELNYNGNNYLTRLVYVRNIDLNNLEIRLNGDRDTYVMKDSLYNEEGAYIYNILSGKEYSKGNIDISGEVNTNIIGNYKVNYNYVFQGSSIIAERIVHVIDIVDSITPEEMTPNEVKIQLSLDSINNYSSITLPDGKVLTSRNIDYTVSKNGIYDFIIKTSNNKEYTRSVKIDNIVGNYICTGEVNSSGITLQVSPSSEVKEYEWVINNTTTKGTNTYSNNKGASNASVNLVFENGKKYSVQCNITDKLVYHFKYDEFNQKPKMRCNTYTASDKAMLDAKLKQVVSDAGYGTRAGVVAAARFIVGGLDYKVPYQGGKTYNREGLNIGQSGAWGCSGSGLDCYHFVDWVRSQNGLELDAYYAGVKEYIGDAVNSIKVGDYLLSPCTSSTCKNPFKINHIGLIIGIDENYIYVAESTTGNIEALIVSKLDKKNLPGKNKGFSLVRHVDYPSEGNVTDMWTE